VRWVDALAVTAVTGLLLATLAILVANRLLPEDLAHRGEWEQAVFWGAWLIAFAHASWRTAPVRRAKLARAWAEQCRAIAMLRVAAVLLNWVTTGDHLLRTIASGYWPVAGLDLALLTAAGLALCAALSLRLRAQKEQGANVGSRRARSEIPESARA
jgi:hypothetical protein